MLAPFASRDWGHRLLSHPQETFDDAEAWTPHVLCSDRCLRSSPFPASLENLSSSIATQWCDPTRACTTVEEIDFFVVGLYEERLRRVVVMRWRPVRFGAKST